MVAAPRDGRESPDQTLLAPVEPFESVFREEYPGLVALAWSLTGSRESAEDIAQDVLLSLYRRWDTAHSITHLHAYLRRSCVNLATSTFRRKAAELRAQLRLRSQTNGHDTLPHEAEGFCMEVRRLPRRQAQVLALHYGYDLSVEQVAHTLELSPGTVKSYLSRGRAAITAHLDATTLHAGEEAPQ